MTNDDGFLQGDNEPAASRVILVGALVSALIFMVVFSILYPGQNYPVISDFETFGALTGGIWFFILGIMLGFFSLLANILFKAVQD